MLWCKWTWRPLVRQLTCSPLLPRTRWNSHTMKRLMASSPNGGFFTPSVTKHCLKLFAWTPLSWGAVTETVRDYPEAKVHQRCAARSSRKVMRAASQQDAQIHLPPPPCREEWLPLDEETRKRLVLVYHNESIIIYYILSNGPYLASRYLH